MVRWGLKVPLPVLDNFPEVNFPLLPEQKEVGVSAIASRIPNLSSGYAPPRLLLDASNYSSALDVLLYYPYDPRISSSVKIRFSLHMEDKLTSYPRPFGLEAKGIDLSIPPPTEHGYIATSHWLKYKTYPPGPLLAAWINKALEFFPYWLAAVVPIPLVLESQPCHYLLPLYIHSPLSKVYSLAEFFGENLVAVRPLCVAGGKLNNLGSFIVQNLAYRNGMNDFRGDRIKRLKLGKPMKVGHYGSFG